MPTINISIPSELKKQIEKLVEQGFYSSFSDACRDALRKILPKNEFEEMVDYDRLERAAGKQAGLPQKEINKLFSSLE